MHASYLLTLGAAALASAVPSTPKLKFEVTNFVFGCSGSCYYSFNVTAPDSAVNHPAILTPVTCSGGLDETTDYKQCGNISTTQSISAYIVKATNELKLRYDVRVPTAEGGRYQYDGEREVYSATGSEAKKQKKRFSVREKATKIA